MRLHCGLVPGAAALRLFSLAVAQAPSPGSIGSDLSILVDNELSGNLSARETAVIVLGTPQTADEARTNCALLGESLWSPPTNANRFHSGISLEYLGYADTSSRNLEYWIGGGVSDRCRTLNEARVLASSSCFAHKLPALCTQSAPLSTADDVDTSARWQTVVQSGNQRVTGYRDKLSFRFEGLRYAPQPTRFTYSTLYNGTSNASALSPGPQCVQSGCTTSTCSEDCLFLNVWTPYLPVGSSAPKSKLKPVMFWIHGGAFTGGTGSDSTFDGGNMASRGDVVVVTINYRLSTLGFLALDDGATNGNFGLADQITALEWVQAHIKDFGGDPDRITIFGQSAGAASVRALLASPKAIGKYQAAIQMSNLAGSNYATTYSQYYSIEEEVDVAANPILNETGCVNATDRLACLRAYDALELVSLKDMARYLVVDGTYLRTPDLELTGSGPAAPVPLLIGVMRDDAAAFIGYPSANQSFTSFLAASGFANSSALGTSSAFQVPYDLYPTNASLAVFNATARVATDSEMRCLDQATAYSGAKNGVFPRVFFYEFDRSYQTPGYDPNAPVCDAPKTPEHPAGDPRLEYFRCHSGELYFVFGTLVRQGLPIRDDGDLPFSRFALDSWTAFARTADPNPDPAYLKARGYASSLEELQMAGRWAQVNPAAPSFRNLKWPVSQQLPFKERQQCDTLGLPLDYYEK